jgi:5-methylcytosine-specific restriction enzyme subunit McrC
MRIELTETGGPVEVPLSHAAGQALRASGMVTASPSVAPGYWVVGPAGKVGVARIADVEVWIRSKVEIRRLFFLLGYAAGLHGWRDDELDLREDADLLTVVATAFARQAEKATRQGLLQGYRTEDTASPVLRGRIRADDQLKRHFGIAVPLEVRYDEYDFDIPENQLLRAAAEVLLRLGTLDDVTRRSLHRLVRTTADVTPLPAGVVLPSWTPSRLNARYHTALGLAELVLRGHSVEQAVGDVRINGFVVDMAKVFEDFLSVALGEALTRRGGTCRAQERWLFDEGGDVPMKPDIVWYATGSAQPSAVIDAKYKAEKPSGFPNADLYQMLAYCSVLGLERGHLVYAQGNEEPGRRRVRRLGTEIVQHTIDLTLEPRDLLDQVDALADTILAEAVVAET